MPRVPLNLRKNQEEIEKSLDGYAPSWRDPIAHPYKHNDPQSNPKTADRFVGNALARRYVTGDLDYNYLMLKIADVIFKYKDGDFLTPPEQALLATYDPKQDNKLTQTYRNTYIRITDEEANTLRAKVDKYLATVSNWQAGRGGGKVPGADTIRPDTIRSR